MHCYQLHHEASHLVSFLFHLQTENKPLYNFTVEFIRKTSSCIEPYIHLVRLILHTARSFTTILLWLI